MSFIWNHTLEYNDLKELYELVIPKEDLWNPHILTKQPNIVKGFIARDTEGITIACAIIANLNNSNAMYIDCFAISPKIRGNRLSYQAWNSFIEFLNKNFPEINTNRLIIEVYLQNISIWNKVMGIDILHIEDMVTKPKLITPTIIMGKNLGSKLESVNVYNEWQQIESSF